MTNYLWYLLEANLVLVLLFGVFKLIQSSLSFSWQRFSLLSIPLLSGLAVWLKHGVSSGAAWTYHIPVIELETVSVHRQNQPHVSSGLSWIETGYWIGVTLLSVWVLFSLYQILRAFFSTKHHKEAGFSVMEVPDRDASSFFRFIQLPAGLPEQDRRIIFEHEQIHAQKLHSADRLYVEALHCFSWFNPLFLLLKKELIQIHEFEVDQIMYQQYRAGYMEFLLAYSLGTSSSFYLLTNQFMTKLTLIKRIKIMKNTSKKRWITALALPLIAGTLTLVSFTKEPAAPLSNPQQPSQVETEVDKQPEFAGGTEALMAYLSNNIHYPESAVKAKTTGKVMVSFVVSKSGKVTQAKIKKGVSKELDAEALRVVSGMPDWTPGEKDGKKVDAEMFLPIAFQL